MSLRTGLAFCGRREECGQIVLIFRILPGFGATSIAVQKRLNDTLPVEPALVHSPAIDPSACIVSRELGTSVAGLRMTNSRGIELNSMPQSEPICTGVRPWVASARSWPHAAAMSLPRDSRTAAAIPRSSSRCTK